MSEVLQTENNTLREQLQNQSKGIENLLSQLEAHKGLVNEQLGVNLQLRTNLVLFQKELQKVNAQLADANAKIAALEKPIPG